MKDEFTKEPLSSSDKTRFHQYNAESISQKRICGVERLLEETEKRESVAEIREKMVIQEKRREREEKLNTKERLFIYIHGNDKEVYDEGTKGVAEEIRKEGRDNKWLGEEYESEKEEILETMMKSAQEHEDKSDKACSRYIEWMRATTDTGLQAVIQRNIEAYPMDKIRQIKEAEKEIGELMREDVTITRANIRQQLQNVGMMEQLDDVMEKMEEITGLRRQMIHSYELNGGDLGMRETEYKTMFEKRLGMSDPDTAWLRNDLEATSDKIAWEDIVERVTGIIEKAKIHTRPNQSVKAPSIVMDPWHLFLRDEEAYGEYPVANAGIEGWSGTYEKSERSRNSAEDTVSDDSGEGDSNVHEKG
jgi:hypothetical protein